MHFFFIILGLLLLVVFWRAFAALAVVAALAIAVVWGIALIASAPKHEAAPTAQMAASGPRMVALDAEGNLDETSTIMGEAAPGGIMIADPNGCAAFPGSLPPNKAECGYFERYVGSVFEAQDPAAKQITAEAVARCSDRYGAALRLPCRGGQAE